MKQVDRMLVKGGEPVEVEPRHTCVIIDDDYDTVRSLRRILGGCGGWEVVVPPAVIPLTGLWAWFEDRRTLLDEGPCVVVMDLIFLDHDGLLAPSEEDIEAFLRCHPTTDWGWDDFTSGVDRLAGYVFMRAWLAEHPNHLDQFVAYSGNADTGVERRCRELKWRFLPKGIGGDTALLNVLNDMKGVFRA